VSVTVTFVAPPPGLEPLLDFDLETVDGAVGLYAMHATEDAQKRLYVLDAGIHLREYTPFISDEQCAVLDLTDPEDAMVLVVVNPAASGTTVNLMAPIVVNTTSGIGAQLILEGQDWPLRAELAA
jgi:flagellar assembly factor FliW